MKNDDWTAAEEQFMKGFFPWIKSHPYRSTARRQAVETAAEICHVNPMFRARTVSGIIQHFYWMMRPTRTMTLWNGPLKRVK